MPYDIFQPGQIVKQNVGPIAHYAVVISDNLTVGWVPTSQLEFKPVIGEGWNRTKSHLEPLDFSEIELNIRTFANELKQKGCKYNASEFNCEHWANLMVTGKAYSSQSGAAKVGAVEILGGVMVFGGASAGTAVTFASTIGAAASTGTAISTLSGAAATNAALAWLGGGALAAGGGGVAAGTAIVTAISTGGAAVAIIGVGVITKQVWDNMSDQKRSDLINKIDNAAPGQMKVAYHITADKLSELNSFLENWKKERIAEIKYHAHNAIDHASETGHFVTGWTGDRVTKVSSHITSTTQTIQGWIQKPHRLSRKNYHR